MAHGRVSHSRTGTVDMQCKPDAYKIKGHKLCGENDGTMNTMEKPPRRVLVFPSKQSMYGDLS